MDKEEKEDEGRRRVGEEDEGDRNHISSPPSNRHFSFPFIYFFIYLFHLSLNVLSLLFAMKTVDPAI